MRLIVVFLGLQIVPAVGLQGSSKIETNGILLTARGASGASRVRNGRAFKFGRGHFPTSQRDSWLRPVATKMVASSASRPSADLEDSSEDRSVERKAAGMTFFYSPSSLRHLSYFDAHESELPPPVFNSTLSSEDLAVDGGDGAVAVGSPDLPRSAAKAPPPAGGAPGLMAGVANALGFKKPGWPLGGGGDDGPESAPADEVRVVNAREAAKFAIDRPARLRAILAALEAGGETVVSAPERRERNTARATELLRRAHTQKYIDELRARADDVPEGEIRPLSPRSARTYIDRRSFDAAVGAVSDWIDAVDHVLGSSAGGGEAEAAGPAFALVRPPSHHACPTRGMGGCLLNGCAIAANYALEAYPNVVRRVAILDVDAHHGNGVAACVEGRRRVRYCSVHEEAEDRHHNRRGEARIDDPRGPAAWDVGPNGNLRNVPLPVGSGWDDRYRSALVGEALPFLREGKPDVLLVACGFDALEADGTSGLRLRPEDYAKMGRELKEAFGNRVVFGLEGGYCWEEGVLGDAVVQLASAWRE